MDSYEGMLARIKADPRYLANISWGKPRDGHPEGTIGAHIAELESNLDKLRSKLSPLQIDVLSVLIHVHDTLKPDSQPGVAICAPDSHASLAAAFLSELCEDQDVLNMVRLHDEPFALWRQFKQRGAANPQRLDRLIATIRDWDTFWAFLLIDNLTAGKSGEPLRWFWQVTQGRIAHRLRIEDVTG